MDTTEVNTRKQLLSELAVLQSRYSYDNLQLLGSMILLAEPADDEVSAHTMGSINMAYDLAVQYHGDLLRQAKESRQSKLVNPSKLPFWPRLTWGFGSWMISVGRKIMPRVSAAGGD